MRRVLVLLLVLGGCDDAPATTVAWLEVAGFDRSIRVEGHGGDVLSLGGYLVTRRSLSRELGFRMREESAGQFELLHDGRATRVRLVAEPGLRVPHLSIVKSKRRGALLIQIDRHQGENSWLLYIGSPPNAMPVGCTTIDGSWMRCDR